MPSESVSSRISKSSQLDINFDFWSFFRICYPDKDISTPHENNAVTHARTVYAAHIQDAEGSISPRKSIDSFVVSRPSDSALRNSFNKQQYIEAVMGLLTRRRVAFSAVEWCQGLGGAGQVRI